MHKPEYVYQPLPHEEFLYDKVRRIEVPGGWLYQIHAGRAWSQPVFVPAPPTAPSGPRAA